MVHRSDTARIVGEEILAKLLRRKEVKRASFAGSLRRKNEIVNRIDLIVSSDSPEELIDVFLDIAGLANPVASEETPVTSQEHHRSTYNCMVKGIEFSLDIVSDDRFPLLLLRLTGNAIFLKQLSNRAAQYGIKFSVYGLFLDDHLLPCQSEKELFSMLGLDFISPELREGRGEIEAAAAHTLPQLVEEKDIRGIFHVHSNYSDGQGSLRQLVEVACDRCFEYIGISDHSQSAFYANGLSEDRIQKQHEEIDLLQEEFQDIRILKGIESDILPGGDLDYDDDILASFDFVIASVHARFKMSEEEMTRRIVRALSHPSVTILGHPTGRLLLSREAYAVNIPAIIAAARCHNVAIELNASPLRLDLDWRYCKLAKEAGVRLSLNPDAHQPESLSKLKSGIGIARKGWLSREDLINTLPKNQIIDYLKNKKNGSALNHRNISSKFIPK